MVLDLPSKTYVVDMAIPWDNSVEAAEHANQEKRRKYNPILHVMSKPTKVLGLAPEVAHDFGVSFFLFVWLISFIFPSR